MIVSPTAGSGGGDAACLIDPGGAWPGDDLDPDSIAAAAGELRSVGREVHAHGATTADHWRRLSHSYQAPEAAQLLAAMDPIRAEAETSGSNTAQAAAALESFADEAAQVKRAVAGIRARAVNLHHSAAAGAAVARSAADLQLTGSASDPAAAAREASAALISEVDHWAAVLSAAEQTCAARIAACTDPVHLPSGTGRFAALSAPGQLPTPESQPWGPPSDRGESAWGAVFGAAAAMTAGRAIRSSWMQAFCGLGAAPRVPAGASEGITARSAVADIDGFEGGATQGGAVPEGGGLQPVGPEGGPKNGPEGQGYRGSNPEQAGRWDQWHRGNGGPYINGTWGAAEPNGEAQSAEGRAFETAQAEAAIAESVPSGSAQAAEAKATSAMNEPAASPSIDDATIDNALSGLDGGRRPHVKVVDNEKELRAVFDRLTEQAAPEVPSDSYRGSRFRLPGGTIIGMRQSSLSGGATIDIRRVNGDITKVHIQPREP